MNALFVRPVGRDLPAPTSREGQFERSWLPLVAYVTSTLLAATVMAHLATGVGQTLISWIPPSVSWTPWVLGVAGVGLASYLEILGQVHPLPERRRQVPRIWLSWRHPTLWAIGYGLELGAGVFTYIYHAIAYVVAAMIILAPTPRTGLALGFVYGLAWSSVAVVATIRGDSGPGYSKVFRGTRIRYALAGVAVVSYAALLVLKS